MRILHALTFLTILPIPRKISFKETDFGRATAFYPLVGVLLGGGLILIYKLLLPLWSPNTLHAILILAWIVFTGGLHLDGVADTVDGLLGGRTQEVKLNIMKDSRIGAFGVLALLALILLKVSFLGELNESLVPTLLLAPTLGRWAMVVAIQFFPVAKPSGMGHLVKQHSGWKELALSTATALACCVLLHGFWGIAILLAAALFTLLIAWVISRQLCGLTGDTYGALCEFSEMFVLVLMGLQAHIEHLL